MVSPKTKLQKGTLSLQDYGEILDSFQTSEQEKYTLLVEAVKPKARSLSGVSSLSHSKIGYTWCIGSLEPTLHCSGQMPYYGSHTLIYDPQICVGLLGSDSWQAIEKRLAMLEERLTKTRGTTTSVAASEQKENNEFEEGEQYYQDHRSELESKYPGEYIAIWQGRVISHGASFDEVAQAAYEQVGYQDIFMPEVGFPVKEVHLPTRRLVR